MDEIESKIQELYNLTPGTEGRKLKETAIKHQIVVLSDLKNKKCVKVGDYILTWHPKIKTKNWPDGIMMIYTKDSYEIAQEYTSNLYRVIRN